MDKGLHPLVLENISVATSGDYMQYVGKHRNNHILGSSDIISVTVISGSLMEADALATCIMLLGKEKAGDFCRNKKIKALLIDESMDEYAFNNIESYFLERSRWIRN